MLPEKWNVSGTVLVLNSIDKIDAWAYHLVSGLP